MREKISYLPLTTAMKKVLGTPFYRRKRGIPENTLEVATSQGNFDYWLSHEDIADIARIEYSNFATVRDSPIIHLYEIVGVGKQLASVVIDFKNRVRGTREGRLTLTINLGNIHWTTLVINYLENQYTGYYIDSQGKGLPQDYSLILDELQISLHNLNVQQQTIDSNCGLWALENAAELNKLLDRRETLGSMWTALNRQETEDHFIRLRKVFSEKLQQDSLRRARLHNRNDDEESPSSSKRVKVSLQEQLETRLEPFVFNFINDFTEKLAAYYLNAKGDRLTINAIKKELKVGTTGALIGSAIVQSIAGSVPSVIGSVRTLSSKFYASGDKAQKITKLFSNLPKGSLAKLLSEAATEIFSCYESQFMEVSDEAGTQIAMDKLAEDATSRAFDYLYKNSQEISHVTRDIITRGVVLGESEKFFNPNINKVRIRVYGKQILDGRGHQLSTSAFFKKTGIFFLSGSGDKKFYKLNGLTSENGFRRAFPWEKEENGEFKDIYQRNYEAITTENEAGDLFRSDYSYGIPLDSVVQKAASLLHKINQLSTTLTHTREHTPNPQNSLLFNLQRPIHNFFGREALLTQLHNKLSEEQSTAVIMQSLASFSLGKEIGQGEGDIAVSLVGLGGIGKTQLALRYAERYAANYDNKVIWLNAGTEAELMYSLTKLAVKLTISNKDINGFDKNPEALMEDIYGFFSGEKCLIVFDNVENYHQIQKFLPKSSATSNPTILITSRYANWENVCPAVSVGLFTEQESIQFVKWALNIQDSSQDTNIKELYTLLQGLPLALQQAVAYIKCQKNVNRFFAVSDYVHLFKLKSEDLLSFDLANYANDPYTKTVLTTWRITIDKIKAANASVGEKAIEILHMMAYLYPDNISNTLFERLPNSDQLSQAIHLLQSYSLINESSEPNISTIHRLVQKVVRINLEKSQPELESIFEKLIFLTERYLTDKEVGFHYIYFLLYISQQTTLLKNLSIRATPQRILALMDSGFDIGKIDNILDTAKEFYTKQEYLRFIGEAIFTYTRFPLLLLLSTTLDYIEKQFKGGFISATDFDSILDYAYIERTRDTYSRLAPDPEERNMQLNAVRLVAELEKKIHTGSADCTGSRKKRSLNYPCGNFPAQDREITAQRRQKLFLYVNRIVQICELTNTGLFTKSTLAALIRGDFDSVVFNFSLLVGGKLLGRLAHSLNMAGESLSVAEKQILFNQMIAPFVQRGISLFFAFKLLQQCGFNQSEHSCESAQIIPGAIVGLDILQSSIEAAESAKLIEFVSDFSGPIGEILGTSLWLTLEAFEIRERIKTLEEHVHLSQIDILVESIRAFLGEPPSPQVITTAYLNAYIAQGIALLKNHTQFNRYVFSIGNPSEVYLNNETYLQLKGIIPDEPTEGDLFCLRGTTPITSSKWNPIVPYPPTMERNRKVVSLCENAIGISYLESRSNNLTLIALGEGENTVTCNPMLSSVLILNNGIKVYQGGNQGDLYVLEGDNFFGELRGGNGIDSVSLERYNLPPNHYLTVDSGGTVCRKHYAQSFLNRCYGGLNLKRINRIYGRPGRKDVIYITKEMGFIDGGGGAPSQKDLLYITPQVEHHLQIVLKGNTHLKYTRPLTNLRSIDYLIPEGQVGLIEIEALSNPSLEHRFWFEYALENLCQLTISNGTRNFVLSSNQEKLNLTIRQPNIATSANNFTYQFRNQEQLKLLSVDTLVIQPNNNLTLSKTISYYSAIATQLDFALTILLPSEETVLIGKQNSESLSNNPLQKSHLIGKGKNKLFLITSAQVQKFPIPEVTLYRMDQGDSTDALDFDPIILQARQECPQQKFAVAVYEHDQDLIIQLLGTQVLSASGAVFNCTQKKWISTWDIASIRLKNALFDNWYQQLVIHLNNKLMAIFFDGTDWRVTNLPFVVPPNKDTVNLEVNDVATNTELNILKLGGELSFFRYNGSELVITNVVDPNTSPRNLIAIVCKGFYILPEWQDELLFRFIFLDQKIVLNEQINLIGNATDFSEVLEKKLNISLFLAVQDTSTSQYVAGRSQEKLSHDLPASRLYQSQSSSNSYGFNSWLVGVSVLGASIATLGVVGVITNRIRQSRTRNQIPATIYAAMAVPLLQKTSASVMRFLDEFLSSEAQIPSAQSSIGSNMKAFQGVQDKKDLVPTHLVAFSDKGFFKINSCHRFPTFGLKGGFCVDEDKLLLWWKDRGRINWGTVSQYDDLIKKVTANENYVYISHPTGSTEVLPVEKLKISGDILAIIPLCPQNLQEKLLAHWRWDLFKNQAQQIGWHIIGSNVLLHTPVGDLFKKFGLKIDWRSREDSYILLRWLSSLNHMLYPELFLLSPLRSAAAITIDTLMLLPRVQRMWCQFTGYDITLGKKLVRLMTNFIELGFTPLVTILNLITLSSDSPRLATLCWGFRLLLDFSYQQDRASFYYCVGLLILPQLPGLLESIGIPVTHYLSSLVNRLSALFITKSFLTAIDLQPDQGRLFQSRLEYEEGENRSQQGRNNSRNRMHSTVRFFKQRPYVKQTPDPINLNANAKMSHF